MEDNRQNQELPNQDIEFIKEKVKERPLNRKKLVKRTLLTASMAVIFGLIACLTFLVLEPVFSNLLYPEEEPQMVELKEEDIEDEMRPEDMILEETESAQEEPQTVIEKVPLEISDYQTLYRNLYAVAKSFSDQSLVTVTGVVSDIDWFDNTYENEGESAGVIVADNGKEFLVLVENRMVQKAESLEVTFADGNTAPAQIKGADEETGLAVISILREEIPESTKANLKTAVMGSPGSGILASPVIAVGRPQGTETVVFGMVTSTDSVESLTDHNVHLLKTDMTGMQNGGGVLLNLSGQIVGILKGTQEESGMTAYGVADLIATIGKLSNGQEIAHMGINGTDVPETVHLEKEVPRGAYVTGIVMDSPAMKAGIQSGDVIVKVQETEITSFTEYHAALLELAPGTTVNVTLMRQGQDGYQEMQVDVILE